MNFLLSIVKKHGANFMNMAWGYYDEQVKIGAEIKNPPGYFNGIIQDMIKKKEVVMG